MADWEIDPVRISCARCRREWSEPKADLLRRFGDAPMPGLKRLITQCDGYYTDTTKRCDSIYAGIDYAALRRQSAAAMRRYQWTSQLIAADARVWVCCRACGRQSLVVRERLRRWLNAFGRGRDLSIAELQARLRCGHGREGSEFGCGQRQAVLRWVAGNDVPPPDPKLRH